MDEQKQAKPETYIVKPISEFYKILGEQHGLPDNVETKPTTFAAVDISGRGGIYTVLTIRGEKGDTVFITCSRSGETIEMILPPAVAKAIARQREALSTRTRSKVAKRVAQERKDRGELPGFMRAKKGEAA